METTQLSSKGQLVLPQRVRKLHGWTPGTVFEVKEVAEGVLLTPVAPRALFAPTEVAQVFGIGKQKGPRLSLEQMELAVEAEARRRR